MRILVLLITLFTFSHFSMAQESNTISFFFNVNESFPIESSKKAIDTFNLYISTHPITILEINSYSSKDGSKDINQHIAEERLNAIKSLLNKDLIIEKSNVYGINYPNQLIYPIEQFDKWRRVDVIYSKTKNQIDTISFETKTKDTTSIKSQYIPNIEESVKDEIYDKKLEKGMAFQMELNIQFFDGTFNLTPGSSVEIDKLAEYLNANKDVHAYIRGHVCCGKAMKLSKQRAKLVLKELVKRGVSKKRLRSQGFSNNLPMVTPEKTEEDRRKNRRVDILFSVK